MTMFDYAQSNSLLKRQIDEKHNDKNRPGGMSFKNDLVVPSQRIDSLTTVDAGALVIPMNDPATSASTGITKEKIIPTKKSQHAKHKFGNGAITVNERAKNANASANANATTTNQQTEPEMKTLTQEGQSNDTNSSIEKKNTESKPKKRVRKPRRAIPTEKEYIPADAQPTQSDVVGGRGGRSNHHPGNRPYWIRILESRLEYTRSRSDHEKARIASGILRYVQEELNGRFLNIESKTKRWYILPDAVVLDKIKQALRDKYIPYWARDLKIENKKRAVNSVQATKNAAAGNFPQMLGMGNKAHPMGMNSFPAFGSSFGGMQNQNLVNQAVQLAAMKASRVNAAANPFGFAGVTAAKPGAPVGVNANPPAPNNKNGNKLGFLFGTQARRPLGPTAAIPTVDDILKCKVDQMPSFGGLQNTGFMAAAMASVSAPPLPSIGMNPFQSPLPPSLMNSLGLGGLPGPGALLNDTAHRGFGAGGNPGAPALPPTATFGNLGQSIGVLQNLNMKSLDKYMEEKMTGPSLGVGAFGSTAANLASLNMMNALAGTSFDSSASNASPTPLPGAFPPAAQAPATSNSKKTDWNAMYAKALTKSK